MFFNLEGIQGSKKGNRPIDDKVRSGILKASVYENKHLLLDKMNVIANYRVDRSLEYFFKNTLAIISEGSSTLFNKGELEKKFSPIYKENSNFGKNSYVNLLGNYCKVNSLYSLYQADTWLLGSIFEKFVKDLGESLKAVDYSKNQKGDKGVKIVVAGQFSAGKSTFINSLINNELLPSDTSATSSIATYINFEKDINQIEVNGINQREIAVPLEKELLDYLKHGTQANEILATVINKLIVTVPNQFKENFILVDTPGHNKSDVKNTFNNKRDYDVALEMTKNCDVLFYVMDINKGGLQESDINFLNKVDSDVYIIFTRAKERKLSDVKIVVDKTVTQIASINYLEGDKKITKVKNIIAYDSVDREIVYMPLKLNVLKNKITIDNFINNVLENRTVKNSIDSLDFDKLFKNIIEYYGTKIERYRNSYSNLLKRELNFLRDGELVERNIGSLNKQVNKCIKNLIDNDYLNIVEGKDKLSFRISYFEEIIKILNYIKNKLQQEYKKELFNYNNSRFGKIAPNQSKIETKTIYQVIEQNDIDGFFRIFSTEGINILANNSQNYSVMTYVAKYGNIEMVKCLLNYKVDIKLVDKKGYNMFHTAIENGYIKIIEELIKYDPSIIHSRTTSGEDYKTILKKQNYYKLIENCANRYGY